MAPSRSAAAQAGDAVPVFAALADRTRLGLLRRLSVDGPLSITRLSAGSGVTRQAITRHLEALGAAGLVRNVRRGRERVFDLDLKRLEIAKRYLEHIAAGWDAAAVPSATLTWPACSEFPIPTPPPWWNATQLAPDAVFSSALRIGQSAIASEPSSMPSVSRNGDATLPVSR